MAFDQIFEVTTPASLSPVLIQKQHQWPIIARDLVLMDASDIGATYSIFDIAKAYDVSISDMQLLLEAPLFQKYIKAEKNKLEALGPHAGSKVRAETMAMDLQEVLYLRAKNGTITDAVILKFIEHLARVSGLEDTTKDKNINQNAVNITINVPKLNNPKLAHLYPKEEVVID